MAMGDKYRAKLAEIEGRKTPDDIIAEELANPSGEATPVIHADDPAAPPVMMTMDQVLQLIRATQGGTQDIEGILSRVMQATANANANAMQTALNRSNPNYVPKSPYHYADGRPAEPKFTVYFGPSHTDGKGAMLPKDAYFPAECDLINRFDVGQTKTARNGDWSAQAIQNGSTQELIIKVPMGSDDQRRELPSFQMILRELLDGAVAASPERLAERVAELERKLAAAGVAA